MLKLILARLTQHWKEQLKPKMNSTSKHLLHCILLLFVVVGFEIFAGGIKIDENSFVVLDPWAEYGTILTLLLYSLRFLTFLTLPQVLFNFCGLVFYNAFPEKVTLKGKIIVCFICLTKYHFNIWSLSFSIQVVHFWHHLFVFGW